MVHSGPASIVGIFPKVTTIWPPRALRCPLPAPTGRRRPALPCFALARLAPSCSKMPASSGPSPATQ
eukprot:159977-Alexandrium_andersonii.AAC.1